MSRIYLWLTLSILVFTVSARVPTQAVHDQVTRNHFPPPPQPHFVTVKDCNFIVNGSPFKFVGTNAYWLHTLNTDEDIDNTLANISASNFTVVRTWAFNDVSTIPENGTWFQLLSNGTATINNGTNGLQRLDKVIELAGKHGLFVLLSLTNNWNPGPLDNTPPGVSSLAVNADANATRPRGTLSNDYGGMDMYVRNFGDIHEHDQFFMNDTIINAFKNYTSQIVSRYVNNPSILAWELANDPRCNSTLPNAASCNTNTVTSWHATVAQHIKDQDPNHLVSTGSQGFFCPDCLKLFPRFVPLPPPPPPLPPPPQPSPAPGSRRRSVAEPVTRARLLKERKAIWKKARAALKQSGGTSGGIKVRGRWTAPITRRQDVMGMGPAFDGSFGVDSEDLANTPGIAFSSFQLFPDQNTYGLADPTLSPHNQTVQVGLDWIKLHGNTCGLLNVPTILTGFGLVTMNNSANFVPFNSSMAPFASDQGGAPAGPTQQPFGFTDQERDDAYFQWVQSSFQSGIQGVMQYQWGQENLTPGNTVSPNPTGNDASPNQNSNGVSPNDGYSIQGVGDSDAVNAISEAFQPFAPDA